MAFNLIIVFALIVLSFDFSYCKSTEDKLMEKYETIKKKAIDKCEKVKSLTPTHLNEGIAACVQAHLDNPPFKIEQKYFDVYKSVKANCWETIPNYCPNGAIDKGLKCTIPKIIMYASEGEKIYNANKDTVVNLVNKVMPCALGFIDRIN